MPRLTVGFSASLPWRITGSNAAAVCNAIAARPPLTPEKAPMPQQLQCHSSAATTTLETPERLVKSVGADTFLTGLCLGQVGQVVGKLLAHRLGTVPDKSSGVCRAESTAPYVSCRPQSSNDVSLCSSAGDTATM